MHGDDSRPVAGGENGAAGALLAASVLALYTELTLIRWIPATVHVVAFFNNLVLIACFLGLGVGMARPRPAAKAVASAVIRLAVVVALLVTIHVVNPTTSLPAGGDYSINEVAVNLVLAVPLPAVMLGVFGLATWAMIPLGWLVAGPFDRLPRLRAYSINVAGSLLGVLGFAAVSWLELPPVAWFAGVLAGLWALDRRRAHAAVGAAILLAIVSQDGHDSRRGRDTIRWSPYYKVVARPLVPEPGRLEDGFAISVNHQFLLSGLDLRPEAELPASADPEVARDVGGLKSYYNFPFGLEARPPRRVLVLGAGAGNDVAAALRAGAEHVTAVEIDPLVLRLGRAHHPERPYEDPRVRVVCDDARAFLNRSRERFDLILFATLDAHGLLSSVGNVRLDSFIYTRESLESARRHLAEGGLMVLSFGPFREEVQFRQYATIRSVFGGEPLYFHHANGHRTLVAGDLSGVRASAPPAGWSRIGPEEIAAGLRAYPGAATPATDDWPHLFIRERRVPREYLGVLAGMLVLALALVGATFRGSARPDGHFFALGAGFLLLETKGVTEFALLIGSTWQVNAAVFSVILLMILAANALVQAWGERVPVKGCYVLIIACLLAEFAWPVGSWGATGAAAYALGALYLGVPVVLAAVIFGSTFREAPIGSIALASNLLGAVLGGASEYLSLAFGLRVLSLLALGMYAVSFVFWAAGSRRRSARAVEARPVPATARHRRPSELAERLGTGPG